MTGETCNDNRFELIAKYKQKLIEATNIETSEEEMAVIDNVFFRFWQIGWLDLFELKEQNRIIELPVPIGTKVYGIGSDNEIYEFEISINFPLGMLKSLMIVWGKEVFATREEAQKRLEELRR